MANIANKAKCCLSITVLIYGTNVFCLRCISTWMWLRSCDLSPNCQFTSNIRVSSTTVWLLQHKLSNPNTHHFYQKVMILIFISSCLLFTFARFELCDNKVMFCDDINNYAVEICYIIDVTHTNSIGMISQNTHSSSCQGSFGLTPTPKHSHTIKHWLTLTIHTHTLLCRAG